ncbi:MAG: RNA polymerase sigma factor [Planctomycetaceae bacterium]
MKSAAPPSQHADDPGRRLAAGDQLAFSELYDAHSSELLAFLATRLRSTAEAEEVLQEVWMKVWEKREQFQDGSFRAWVFQIARTTTVDRVRKVQRRREVGEFEDEQGPADHRATSSEVDDQQEKLQALRDCLKSVGSDFVMVLQRTRLNGESIDSVARELGVKPDTIYTKVHRAKKLLEDCTRQKLQ